MARERLCLRATTDYWVNAMDGQPFLYVNKEVDPGLIRTLKQEVIAWLEANTVQTPEQEQRLATDARAHWFTMVFDREGYSPELFEQMAKKRIAILSYHKFPGEEWRPDEFHTQRVTLAGGESVELQLAERGHAAIEQTVGAGDSQADRKRASELDSDDELRGADEHAGGVAIRAMESGKLLPVHAGTL